MRIRTVTVDHWGTLLFDPLTGDDRHKPRRLADLAAILGDAGVTVTLEALDRAYRESGTFLAHVWMQNRDVPVEQHVRVLLADLDPTLIGRLPGEASGSRHHRSGE